ncbi:MAG: hypothetical protein KAR83_01200 [Thermodesulfovibrionales bacterium]|nr:hypothetical protein [Thermodesulfovibrionales bacterium]
MNKTSEFRINSEYEPAGDQPEAIKSLVDGLRSGKDHQVLLGVTDSGSSSHEIIPQNQAMAKGSSPCKISAQGGRFQVVRSIECEPLSCYNI